MDISETMMSKLVNAVNEMSTWICMNIKGQGHPLTLVQGHQCQHFQTSFPEKTTMPTEAKFHLAPQWDGGTKVCSNGPGHMTKMATMLIYDKNMKNSSSLEPKGQ